MLFRILIEVVDKLRFNKVQIREEFRAECQELLSFGKIEELDKFIMNKTTKSNKTIVDKKFEYFRKNKEPDMGYLFLQGCLLAREFLRRHAKQLPATD